jgi:hypothetical protein
MNLTYQVRKSFDSHVTIPPHKQTYPFDPFDLTFSVMGITGMGCGHTHRDCTRDWGSTYVLSKPEGQNEERSLMWRGMVTFFFSTGD